MTLTLTYIMKVTFLNTHQQVLTSFIKVARFIKKLITKKFYKLNIIFAHELVFWGGAELCTRGVS